MTGGGGGGGARLDTPEDVGLEDDIREGGGGGGAASTDNGMLGSEYCEPSGCGGFALGGGPWGGPSWRAILCGGSSFPVIWALTLLNVPAPIIIRDPPASKSFGTRISCSKRFISASISFKRFSVNKAISEFAIFSFLQCTF